jgi:hypothetical protein
MRALSGVVQFLLAAVVLLPRRARPWARLAVREGPAPLQLHGPGPHGAHLGWPCVRRAAAHERPRPACCAGPFERPASDPS